MAWTKSKVHPKEEGNDIVLTSDKCLERTTSFSQVELPHETTLQEETVRQG
ncbi:unnamed protein product [Linum tenue]|uniref:Uncharacterized protein n=1 Tax=Linum tenue TaxID=586396 RepID=A0AAV0J1U0_9ROSI|nr:unnamed protein product [Linum tenue]